MNPSPCKLVFALTYVLAAKVSAWATNRPGFGAAPVRILQLIVMILDNYSVSFGPTPVHPLTDKYFQLEEKEDAEACTTEVFLGSDNTVTVGETDGPVFLRATGTWEMRSDGSFLMVLKQTFRAGREGLEPTDMGKFEFEVERDFVGELTSVGDSVAVSGSMHHEDEIGDREVGFFSDL